MLKFMLMLFFSYPSTFFNQILLLDKQSILKCVRLTDAFLKILLLTFASCSPFGIMQLSCTLNSSSCEQHNSEIAGKLVILSP